MNCPVSDLLTAAFPRNPPNDIQAMVQPKVCRPLLTEFKVGVVLPLGKHSPTRIAWSAQGEEKRFHEMIAQRHANNTNLLYFLNSAPASCRRVLDTDGEFDQLFLDDLQHHGEKDRDGNERICRIWEKGKKTVEMIRLGPKTERRFIDSKTKADLSDMGGIWAGRKQAEQWLSTLWISESKWRKNTALTSQWVDRKNPPKAWRRIREALTKYNFEIYPDAIEFHRDGRIDLTVGIV